MDQNAVVGIQRHHISDAAQRHQIEQLSQVRLGPALTGEPVQLAQPCAQGQQHIEDNADPSDALAGEGALRLIGVDDGISRRQFVARQVMIGHQHLQTSRLCRRHAVDTGNAVVHRHQQIGLALQGNDNDFRGQTVPVLEAIGHQVIDVGSAKLAQAKYTHGAGRRAIGIEIADEQDALTLFQRLDQQFHRGIDALELLIRNQPRQPLVQLLCAGHATGRVEALQQRR